MPIFTETNDRKSYFEELALGLDTAVFATAADTMKNNPTSALLRIGELAYKSNSDTSPLIAADDARKRVEQNGLKLEIPDDGIREAALDLIMKRKQKEIEINQIMAQGPTGFGPTVAKFGTSIVTSLIDPLNIASAFIPVVGEARYTTMLENAKTPLSRAFVRAQVGAVEGAAGAAMLEPLIYGANKYEQADYTMTNSLENIAFGGVFGGGLHMGVGAIKDAIAAGRTGELINNLSSKTRNDALKAAVSQLVEGKQVNVEPILLYDPKYMPLKEKLLSSTSLTNTSIITPDILAAPNKIELSGFPESIDLNQANRTVAPLLDSRGEITVFKTFDEADSVRKNIERRSGINLEIFRKEDGTFIFRNEFPDAPIRDGSGNIFAFDTERQANKALDTILSLKDKNATPIPFYENGKVRYTLFENASPEFIAAAKKDPTLVSFDDTKKNRWSDTSEFAETSQQANARLEEAMKQARDPAKSITGSIESSQQATKYIETKLKNETNPNAIDNELDIQIKEAQDTSVRLGMEADYKQSVESMDALIEDADAMARGIEAAAVCGLRRG